MPLVEITNGTVSALGAGSISAPDWVQCGDLYDSNTGQFTQSTANSDAAQWFAFLANGWTDSETGLKLKTRPESFALFSAMQTGIAEGIALGAITADTPVQIWDFNDTPHTVSTNTARRLLFRYVLAWKTAFDAYAP